MNEYEYLKDVPYTYNADIGIAYSTPCRGLWNIVHIGTQVPECHQIFVCPTSCLRGVVLTTAEMHAMDRLSTITVGEDNILEGNMEETLQEGVEKVIDSLPTRPRMIMVFISCIHHFLAANYQRVYNVLRKEYPDIDFVDAYMDPIMRRKTPPIPSLTRQIYRVLQPCEKNPKQVNYIGNWFPFLEHSDITTYLTQNKITICDLASIHDYETFKTMQESCMNITFHRSAAWARKDLELRLQQPWIAVNESYDYDVINYNLKKVCRALKIVEPSDNEIQQWQEDTERVVREVQLHIGDTPIAIDGSAIDEPFSLSIYLLQHHFNVESLFIDNILESQEVFDTLKQLKPDVKIYASENWNMRMMNRNHEGKILGIGQRAAYYNNTNYFLDFIQNAGMEGYRGIQYLMNEMKIAYDTPKDMKSLVQVKGWRCQAK